MEGIGKNIEELAADANRAEDEGNLELALSLWKDLTQTSDSNAAVYFLKYGRAAQKLGRWEEAESAYSKAIEIVSESSILFELMGSLWANRTDKDERASFETAKEWFVRSVAIKKSARLLTQLGAVQVALQDKSSAAQTYEEALRLDERYEEAMYNLARLRESTQPDEAIRLLERAIEIDPSYKLAHHALGKLIQKKREFARAEYHFRRCLEIDPKDYWSMLYLANALSAQGKTAESELEYEKAVAFDPTIKIGHLLYAKILHSNGKPDQAAEIRSSIERRWH